MTTVKASKRDMAILNAHAAGQNVSAVAASAGVCRATVRKVLRQYGVQVRAYRLTDQELERARILLSGGMSYEQAAKQVGRSAESLRNHLPGYTRRPVRPFTEQEIRQCMDLLTDGASYEEVARTVGRSAAVVWRKFPGFGWASGGGVEFQKLRRRLDELRAVS